MIVRTAEEVAERGNFVDGGDWTSARYLTQSDGLAFSLNDTRIRAGSSNIYAYANHIEACLCIEGRGEVEALDSGAVKPIFPGVLYALDKHDRHRITAITDLRLICVFTPALEGKERHDATGAYKPASSG